MSVRPNATLIAVTPALRSDKALGLAPVLQTQIESEPAPAQAETDLSDDIPNGRSVVTSMAEREGVKTETGERGEAAQDPDEHERSHGRREVKASAGNPAGQGP